VGNDRQFASLCQGLDAPDLVTDHRFGSNPDRVAHVDALAEIITTRMVQRPAGEWFDVLTPLGVPCGPVNDLRGAFELAENLGLPARVGVGDDSHQVTLVANPIGLSDTSPQYSRRPPRLGEHTDEVRAWLADGST